MPTSQANGILFANESGGKGVSSLPGPLYGPSGPLVIESSARRMDLAELTMREIPSQIMSIKKLKSAVEEHRDRLSTKKGKVCTFGKNGPVGMQVIDALVEALEAQEQRIDELEKKLSS